MGLLVFFQVNAFFKKLFQGQTSPNEMIKTVYEYATRGSPSQKKLLDGILRMLADEFSHHLHDYPVNVLSVIIEFYGNILTGLVHQ